MTVFLILTRAIAEAVLDKLECSEVLVGEEVDTNTPTQGNPQLTTNEGNEIGRAHV